MNVISTVTGPTSKSVISPLSLADLDAELQELAAEYAAHPERISGVHLPDQIAHFAIY